jgi:hypothetical protein
VSAPANVPERKADPGVVLTRFEPVALESLKALFYDACQLRLPASSFERVTLPSGRTCDDWNVAVRGLTVRLKDARARLKAEAFPELSPWALVETECLTNLYAICWAWNERGARR